MFKGIFEIVLHFVLFLLLVTFITTIRLHLQTSSQYSPPMDLVQANVTLSELHMNSKDFVEHKVASVTPGLAASTLPNEPTKSSLENTQNCLFGRASHHSSNGNNQAFVQETADGKPLTMLDERLQKLRKQKSKRLKIDSVRETNSNEGGM